MTESHGEVDQLELEIIQPVGFKDMEMSQTQRHANVVPDHGRCKKIWAPFYTHASHLQPFCFFKYMNFERVSEKASEIMRRVSQDTLLNISSKKLQIKH